VLLRAPSLVLDLLLRLSSNALLDPLVLQIAFALVLVAATSKLVGLGEVLALAGELVVHQSLQKEQMVDKVSEWHIAVTSTRVSRGQAAAEVESATAPAWRSTAYCKSQSQHLDVSFTASNSICRNLYCLSSNSAQTRLVP
jgi:hypothetical protein